MEPLYTFCGAQWTFKKCRWSTSLWTSKHTKHVRLFQTSPIISFCLFTQSAEYKHLNRSEKVWRFRREFEASPSIHSKIWKKKLYLLKSSYLTVRWNESAAAKSALIDQCFHRVLQEHNATIWLRFTPIVMSFPHFSIFHCYGMSSTIWKNDCQFVFRECLHSTIEEKRSITNIFLHYSIISNSFIFTIKSIVEWRRWEINSNIIKSVPASLLHDFFLHQKILSIVHRFWWRWSFNFPLPSFLSSSRSKKARERKKIH